MEGKEVLFLGAFLQKNDDGTSFISCSGEVDGLPVEFTCSEEEIVPVSTGTINPIEGKPNRFGVQLSKTAGLVLVGIKPSAKKPAHEVNGVQVQPVVYSRLDYITREPKKVAWNIAARKPVAQAQATGAVA